MKTELIKLHNDLCGFNQNMPIVVTYDYKTNIFTLRQLNKIVMLSYMKYYYLSDKSFKIGILTSDGYKKLMSEVMKLIQDSSMDTPSIVMSAEKSRIKFYKTYQTGLLFGPQLYVDLNFADIRSKLAVWMIMMWSSNETRTLYRLMKNEKRYLSEDKNDSKIKKDGTK
jgi:hypothetical protein